MSFILADILKNKHGLITGIIANGFAPADQEAVKKGDKFVFIENKTCEQPYFLTYIGQVKSKLPVHFESLADMTSNADGICFIPIDTYLCADEGKDKNISCALTDGMQLVKIENWIELLPACIQLQYNSLMNHIAHYHDDIKRNRYKIVSLLGGE